MQTSKCTPMKFYSFIYPTKISYQPTSLYGKISETIFSIVKEKVKIPFDIKCIFFSLFKRPKPLLFLSVSFPPTLYSDNKTKIYF